MSWPEKGPNWCSSDELLLIQTRIQGVIDRDVKLIDVV